MALTERLSFLIDAKNDGAVRTFKGTGGELDNLGRKFDNTGGLVDKFAAKTGVSAGQLKAGLTTGLLGSSAALTAFGTDLFKHGADLEQMRAKAEVVFGDQIKVVEKWASANANAMGLTRREAVSLAGNLADLLVPMGFTREEAAKMSTDVTGLAGALSAWSNGERTAAEVTEILQSAMLGERDALKGLGISITAAEVQGRLLQKNQQDLTGTALQQAEALATVELIMEKSTDAQKAFTDSTKTTNERLVEQQARLREVKDEAAVRFTPAMVAVAEASFSASEGIADFGRSGKGIQGIFYNLGDELYDFLDALAAAKEPTGRFLRDVFGIAGGLALNPFNIGAITRRASGGPVSAGSPYVVGENGPELFVPSSSGNIVPGPSRVAGSATAGATVNITINMPPGSNGEDVVRAIKRYERDNGSGWRAA